MATFINPFQSIEMTDVARWQHGGNATLWEVPTHAYGWAARKPGDSTRYPLDIHGFVGKKFGGACVVVQSGFDAADWKRFYPFDAANDWTILPVILVAADRLHDAPAIKTATDTFRHNVGAMADWYAAQLGRRLRLLEPQLFSSRRTAADWYRIYRDQTDRFDLWKVCQDDLLAAYRKRINSNVVYLVTQYCGDTPEWDWDAAGGLLQVGSGWLAVVSSFACCHCYDPNTTGNAWDETIIYAAAHEVGHCLGLPHTPQDEEGAAQSIMQCGKPPSAIFTASEKSRLVTNPFLQTSVA